MTTPMKPLNRRSFLAASTKLVAGGSLITLAAAPLLAQTPAPAARPKQPPKPPAPPPEKVQAVVGQAHRSLEEVRKLVEETPLLANACWDWGGGDFETPLEAAAHTGRRAIAEYLLSKGARPSLYAAAMLGQLDLVKAHLAIDPNAHAIPGPHGFTVLHCAKEGEATAVVEWLLAQGVPEVTHRPLNFGWPEGTKPAG